MSYPASTSTFHHHILLLSLSVTLLQIANFLLLSSHCYRVVALCRHIATGLLPSDMVFCFYLALL
uniref:Uncharacterized protein n=1 Tax=Arion vulgaris TaxID=1028688 RepID=A0A0B7ASP8_9EUPU